MSAIFVHVCFVLSNEKITDTVIVVSIFFHFRWEELLFGHITNYTIYNYMLLPLVSLIASQKSTGKPWN